jgi:hypothetical protein
VLVIAAGMLLRRRGQSAAPERPLSEAERQALKKALE